MKCAAGFLLNAICAFFFLSLPVISAGENPRLQTDRTLLLRAIMLVESGGNPNAIGDNGEARGAFQIHEVYWYDSRYPEPYLPNVWNPTKSRDVVVLYCTKYAGKNASNEVWARTHNGGPKGASKKATLKYWQKVRAKMEELLRK